MGATTSLATARAAARGGPRRSRPRGVSESKGEWTPGWHAATGDLNGDGRTDVVLYDPLSGLGFRFHTVSPGVFDYRPESWRAGAALIGR